MHYYKFVNVLEDALQIREAVLNLKRMLNVELNFQDFKKICLEIIENKEKYQLFNALKYSTFCPFALSQKIYRCPCLKLHEFSVLFLWMFL